MVAEAVVEALERWASSGVPDRPGAWLLTTARRKALDRLRRDKRYEAKLAAVAALPDTAEREPDDRGRLLFTCCHPALDRDAQIALTLRAVVGLTTHEIARAFLVPEPTLAKRLTRAKRKIVDAAIPYRVPDDEVELRARLGSVLRVVYLVFNEGFLATCGAASRRELADDAEWLAALVARLLPEEPEPLGLLAIIRLHLARWAARLDEHGRLVVLSAQDRTRWDRPAIAHAASLIRTAAAIGRPGPYQIEAAIAAVHCEAPDWQQTDFGQILALYSMLASIDPSPVVLLNRAVVLARVRGVAEALAEVDGLAEALGDYHLFHAVRASLLREAGRSTEAAIADDEALKRTSNPAERVLLEERLALARTRGAAEGV